MVVNKGLTESIDESGGLSLCGGGNKSAFLDSMDSKYMINILMVSQKYHPFDMIFTFICNQNLHL